MQQPVEYDNLAELYLDLYYSLDSAHPIPLHQGSQLWTKAEDY